MPEDPQRPATGPHILNEVLQVRGLVAPIPDATAALLRQNAAIVAQLDRIERQLATLGQQLADLPRTLHVADALAIGDPSRHERP